MYKKTVLPNGIRVITEEIPFFKSASLGFWVNTGSRSENLSQNGISHFIEHMMFKGTATKSATEIAEIMDSVGGQLNAFTEKEQTCYYVRVVDIHVPLALELLADMLVNSVFDPVEIERERGVILEEIRMYDDSPDEVIFDIFTKTLWQRHPLGRTILGSKKVISSLSQDDIVKFTESHYLSGNIIVAAAGNIRHDEIVELVDRFFDHQRSRAVIKKSEKPPVEKKRMEVISYKDCEQVYMIVGGKGVSQRDEEKYTVQVLDSIIGGSMSSRLFQEIREKLGLAYSIGSFQNSYYDAGLFGIFAGTSLENIDTVIATTFRIVKEFKEKGCEEKELQRAKEQLKGTISLALESTPNRMIRLAKSEIYHGRLISHEEVFEKIEAVTLEDVHKLAQMVLDYENFGISILGPVKKGYVVPR
ncbi:MAG: M16 family metallopeptidase [Vulcanimicrobiota bacterium]